MASLPPIRRFLIDDFQSEASWIGALLTPLNQLLNTIYANLNNGITIGQNMQAQIVTISVTGSNPTSSFKWNYTTIGAPVGISVINALGASTPIVTTIGAQFSYSAGTVSVTVTGLPSNSSNYTVTLIAWGG